MGFKDNAPQRWKKNGKRNQKISSFLLYILLLTLWAFGVVNCLPDTPWSKGSATTMQIPNSNFLVSAAPCVELNSRLLQSTGQTELCLFCAGLVGSLWWLPRGAGAGTACVRFGLGKGLLVSAVWWSTSGSWPGKCLGSASGRLLV